MKTVLTFGVYDLLHIGHINLFKNAKSLGDELIVAVQNSEVVNTYKPGTKLYYNTEERLFMVNSIKYVTKVISYNTIDESIKNIDFDILAVGPDQNNEHFHRAFNWCMQNGKQIVTIPRTEGISSSILRK